MRIHFHGAAQTVTGSQYLLEINGKRILLECGLYQGRRAESAAFFVLYDGYAHFQSIGRVGKI